MQIFPLILVSVALSALAQIALKSGMMNTSVQRAIADGVPLGIATSIALSPMVLLGIFLYFTSMLIWLFVLSKAEVSYAYPFVSLGFVFTAILGWLIFNDSFSLPKILGTLLIVAGIIVMARH